MHVQNYPRLFFAQFNDLCIHLNHKTLPLHCFLKTSKSCGLSFKYQQLDEVFPAGFQGTVCVRGSICATLLEKTELFIVNHLA